MDKYCDFEWQGWYVGDTTNSGNPGVGRIACDFPPGKVELFGSYERHECGLRVQHLTLRDRGYWYCEMEKYYLGFDRRYCSIYSEDGTNYKMKWLSYRIYEHIVCCLIFLDMGKLLHQMFT